MSVYNQNKNVNSKGNFMKTNTNLSINNSINFGTKCPTKNVLSLATNRYCYKGQISDNKKMITELAKNKNWESQVSDIGAVFFGLISMLKEKYPELNPYISRIVSPEKGTLGESLDVNLRFRGALGLAIENLGKEIDIDPKDVDRVLEKFYV